MKFLAFFHRPILGLVTILILPPAAAFAQPPSTPRRPVTNEYHGVKVIDDYQWLENAQSPEVKAWTSAQNQHTRAYLDRLPVREALEEQLEELYEAASASYFSMCYRTGLVFALRLKPPAQQPVLVTLRSVARIDSMRKIVDPNKLDTNGTTTIDWYVPSLDGRRVAVSLSKKGSKDGTLRFFETATGKELKEKLPRVHDPMTGSSAAWNADGTGVYYTRDPRKGERPEADLNFHQQVWFHRLGTPVTSDRYETGRNFPRMAEIELMASDDGRFILATVANGDGGDFAHHLRGQDGEWRALTKFEDGIKRAAFGPDNALYFLSRKNAPRGKVLRLPPDSLDLGTAVELVEESDAVIEGFAPSAHGLYVQDLVGGPSRIRFFGPDGTFKQTVPLREFSSVQGMLCRRGDELLFQNSSYTQPNAWYLWEPGTNRPAKTILAATAPAEFKDIEVVREFATSKDGTSVPMNILRKKGTKLDGRNPALLNGDGGYGISMAPDFRLSRRLWFDAGGVYVVANLRGGGEFGDDWRKAGSLTRKQAVFDDFAACAEHLIQAGYTNPKKLAIEGGSNGGLLMGALLTQRPALVAAVVSHVGIYDLLRLELEPNGAFNVSEFGSVKDKAQFEALYAYSPLHQVKDATAYPAVFLAPGGNDGRVNPYHSRKLAARLQAATVSDRPVLLRTSAGAGAGVGSALSERISLEADALAFLFDQLGVDLSPWFSSSPIERGPWSGAVTTNSAVVKARLAKPGASARLVVSADPGLTSPVYSASVRAEANRFKIVALPVTGLQPDTPYHYAIEIDGALLTEKRGQFRTFPAGPATFTFAFASCARTGSTNAVFSVIREQRPLFYLNVGDLHYQNIKQDKPWKFRRAYDRVLGSATQADLYRHVPFAYVWDDHDFGGDNSNRKASSHEAARALYEDYVPHYPLASGADDTPIYQSFAVGRAKFILTDLRSTRDEAKKRDDAWKSMMGAKQKAWFKKELLEANGKYPLIFWVSSVPWIGTAGSNYYRVKTNVFGYLHHTQLTRDMLREQRPRGGSSPSDDDGDEHDEDGNETKDDAVKDADADADGAGAGRRRRGPRFPFGEDHWSVFSTERREIANFIKANRIRGLCILHGDSHMLAADDGRDSDYATGGGAPLPVMCAGPLDQNPSLKGGPYSQGVYRTRKGEGCFGLVTVKDDGATMTVTYSGRNNRNEEKVALQFTVPGENSPTKFAP